MHLGQVVAQHPKKNVAEHGRQGLDQHDFPGKGQQQNWGQQQICYQQSQDQPHRSADQQIGGHGAHLLHQATAQLLKKEAGDHPKQSPEARQHKPQSFRIGHLHQQGLRQQVHPQPAGGGAGEQEQHQDEGIHQSWFRVGSHLFSPEA